VLGDQAWSESGLGAPADFDQMQRRINQLEQQVVDTVRSCMNAPSNYTRNATPTATSSVIFATALGTSCRRRPGTP
jgi:hypothetical protein